MRGKSVTINIAKDFSRYPAGRYVIDGPFPGEVFREATLLPALRQYETVVVDFDGTLGYGSSFLEEAFGGVVRNGHFSAAELKARLELRASDTSIVAEVREYIQSARPGSRA